MDADKKDKDYKTKKEEIKKIVDEINNLVIKDFDQMGLLQFAINEDNEASDYFYITKLMQSFLLTQVGGNENIQDQIDEP